ncbi:hypothetical protein AOLI_G00068800 [Acnodon oligacanthus]
MTSQCHPPVSCLGLHDVSFAKRPALHLLCSIHIHHLKPLDQLMKPGAVGLRRDTEEGTHGPERGFELLH